MTRNCLVCGAPIVATYKSANLKYCPLHRPPTRWNRQTGVKKPVLRGVPVLYPGCAKWDRYSKNDFHFYLSEKQFPDGTEYVLDGERHVVCNG